MALGVAALYGVQYWRNKTSPEYQATEYFKNLEKQYAEDPYGGSTPEETLQLFIEALKKGDTDLAARYFLIEDQEQWREDLAKIQEKGLIDEMIADLTRARKYKSQTEGQIFFTAGNEKGEAVTTIDLVKTSSNRWKIRGL